MENKNDKEKVKKRKREKEERFKLYNINEKINKSEEKKGWKKDQEDNQLS